MHRFGEISCYTGHRCQKEITETMVVEAAVAVESESEKTRHQTLVFRQSNHAIANVAGRENPEFLAQAARTSAIVGDGYDCGEIGAAFFQTAKKTRQAR